MWHGHTQHTKAYRSGLALESHLLPLHSLGIWMMNQHVAWLHTAHQGLQVRAGSGSPFASSSVWLGLPLTGPGDLGDEPAVSKRAGFSLTLARTLLTRSIKCKYKCGQLLIVVNLFIHTVKEHSRIPTTHGVSSRQFCRHPAVNRQC